MIGITSITLPKYILQDTLDFLQRYGYDELEAFALWVGEENTNIFHIREVWFPKQYNTDISYEVSDIEVHNINVQLNRKKYTAIAQLHTHPGSAYHSFVDDTYAILTLTGSFSIVLPDYGFILTEDMSKWAVYRQINNEWILQEEEQVNELFQLI